MFSSIVETKLIWVMATGASQQGTAHSLPSNYKIVGLNIVRDTEIVNEDFASFTIGLTVDLQYFLLLSIGLPIV